MSNFFYARAYMRGLTPPKNSRGGIYGLKIVLRLKGRLAARRHGLRGLFQQYAPASETRHVNVVRSRARVFRKKLRALGIPVGIVQKTLGESNGGGGGSRTRVSTRYRTDHYMLILSLNLLIVQSVPRQTREPFGLSGLKSRPNPAGKGSRPAP